MYSNPTRSRGPKLDNSTSVKILVAMSRHGAIVPALKKHFNQNSELTLSEVKNS